jgi:hypothetical protein
VLIDVFDEDSEGHDWSEAMLTRCASRGTLVINPIVFAEVSAGFESIEEVEAARFWRRFPTSTSVRTPRSQATRC